MTSVLAAKSLRRFGQGVMVFCLLNTAGLAKPLADSATEPYETAEFRLSLQQTSQTLVSLAPKAASDNFDFAPAKRFEKRLGNGAYRLGDIDLRLRSAGDETWQDYSSAYKRAAVKSLPREAGVLAAADISPSLGGPLKVVRHWLDDHGQLVLRFTLTNTSGKAVEVGGLGIPMVFDNIITGRTLDEAHEQASFYDPYVGRDGGYLQVARLNGKGPALLVLPEKGTPFELYKPILNEHNKDRSLKIYNDPEPRNMTFEGFYDWMVTAKGFADTDWKGVQQWNEPTSFTLAPGESRSIGLRFVTAPSVRGIEATLIKNQRPVALGIPGYVAPTDVDAALFLHAPAAVKSIEVFPAGAMRIGAAAPVRDGWVKYAVRGMAAGRARLSLTYADGSVQTIHYLVTRPEASVVADMGHFLTTKQWYENPKDIFHRSPSVLGYDKEEGQITTTDTRVWVAGLSDEGGAGPYLAAMMKELDNPVPEEVTKLERFANEVLWGHVQESDGADKYGIHKSIYYYDPDHMPAGTYDPKLNWKTWTSWSKKDAADIGRSFNYPHVAAAWWVLYRLGRYHDGLTTQSWQTYLTRAAETTKAMMTKAPYYTQFGQMEGDVFVAILKDLKREGMTDQAAIIEKMMKERADHWKTLKYPFGSEMPWDSTGQTEVYAWMRYFGYEQQAAETREVILAYDPSIPHWGYNGSARRFWDFLYAGKYSRIERQLHHYGSSNNAIPLFDSFRENPSDFHLLQVAYGGLMGSLSNIDENGFGSAAFHSFPDMMKFDPISGDYGVSFFAHAYTAASYLVDHPLFGWLGFGGNVVTENGKVVLEPTDSARTRVFIAPIGLWLTLDAGKIASVSYDPASGNVSLTLAAKDAHTAHAVLNLTTTTKTGTPYRVTTPSTLERGAISVALEAKPIVVVIAPDRH